MKSFEHLAEKFGLSHGGAERFRSQAKVVGLGLTSPHPIF